MAFQTNMKDLRPARQRFAKKVDLLSRGLANPSAFPDGKITVFPWDSAVDDWIAKRIRKGNVKGRQLLHSVLPQVCDLNGCDVNKFVASEVMMILMISRSIIRNDSIQIEPKCPDCGHAEECTIRIPDDLEKVGAKGPDYKGTDLIVLPDCKDKVEVKVLSVEEETLAYERPSNPRVTPVPDHVARLLTGIVSINGGKADNVVEYVNWFNALSPADSSHLLSEFELMQPQLSTKWDVQCSECGKEFEYSVQLDEDFFRRPSPKGDRATVEVAGNDGVQGKGPDPKPTRRS